MIDSVGSVGVAEDADVFVVGVSVGPEGTGQTLLFQIPTDSDLVDEIVTYCVTDERQATVYGGVRSASINNSTLELVFSEESAATFGTSPVATIHLQVSPSEVDELRAGLRRIFGYGLEEERPALHL